MRFLHFVLLGPILGVLAVIGAVICYVVLDPRIRFVERLDVFKVPVLAAVPHVNTPFTKRVFRVDMLMCICFGILIMAGYLTLAIASKFGWLDGIFTA